MGKSTAEEHLYGSIEISTGKVVVVRAKPKQLVFQARKERIMKLKGKKVRQPRSRRKLNNLKWFLIMISR